MKNSTFLVVVGIISLMLISASTSIINNAILGIIYVVLVCLVDIWICVRMKGQKPQDNIVVNKQMKKMICTMVGVLVVGAIFAVV